MPCNDVTELLRVELDAGDRLFSYQLIKRTCGRAVGEQSLLLTRFKGTPAAELLALDADSFADNSSHSSEEELFLELKHFFAIQSGLRILLGLQYGGAQEPARVARASCEGDRTILDAEIEVNVLTNQIKSCGRCKGCSALASKKSETENES